MLPAARRTVALALALLALSVACGGKSSPPAAPLLELACAVSSSGSDPVLTVLGRARSTAPATAAPITVTMQINPAPVTFTLSGEGWTGAGEFRPGNLLAGMSLIGQAVVDGSPASTSCVVQTGLPAFSAHLVRTATGADLSWSAVPGAVTYRWSLRGGAGGAVVASGSSTGTSAQVAATLDPATLWLAEVGAYAFTGAETSFPSPLPAPGASFSRAFFTGGSGGGDGTSAWQLFAPGDYLGGTLTVGFPAVAAGERLAVLLLNAGGAEGTGATVNVVGTGAPLLAEPKPPQAALARADLSPPGGWQFDRSRAEAGEALVAAFREETIRKLRDGRLRRVTAPPTARGPLAALAALPALPATRSFCQFRWADTGPTPLWLPARLAFETAHAGFYYTTEVEPGITAAVAARAAALPVPQVPPGPTDVAPFWGELGAAFESKIYPALDTYFGPMSDVDGNGKVVFLLANLGKQGSAFTMGYFWPGDIELAAATLSSCPRAVAGNRTDMLYLMDPGTFTDLTQATGANYAAGLASLVEGEYPSVMAHELQHDVNYNARCPAGAACGPDEELWLNEGLSMLSETVAGYGLHHSSSRANVRRYQGELDPDSGLPYYRTYSMTSWEGNPTGNYAGVQAYMQYLLDHASPAMTRALENRWLTGKSNVEAATGIPWELGFARWATAMVVSNEDRAEPNGAAGLITSAGNQLASPVFNLLGDGATDDYVPWHHYTGFCTIGGVRYPKQRTAYVAYLPLVSTSTVSLRRDGWTAFATGAGSGGTATITVQSAASVPPHVVVVKYTGLLPTYTPPVATCP